MAIDIEAAVNQRVRLELANLVIRNIELDELLKAALAEKSDGDSAIEATVDEVAARREAKGAGPPGEAEA